MRVRILRKMWDVSFVPRKDLPRTVDGMCSEPDKPGKSITVAASLTGERRLDVIIHEMLHAADWHKDEEWVEQVASDIARALWRLGYRGPTDGTK